MDVYDTVKEVIYTVCPDYKRVLMLIFVDNFLIGFSIRV